MTPQAMLAALLAAAVLVGWTRLIVWQYRASAPRWRIAALLVLQASCGMLLYLALSPAGPPRAGATLVVATRNAPRIAPGGLVVALPEAPALAGAERVPDLATALRRHPGVRALRVVGAGLEPRDRAAVGGRALAFDAPPVPRGLVALVLPDRIAAGGVFRIGGGVNGFAGGSVELVDPAGARVAVQPLPAHGGFVLTGIARTPGAATFQLRVRDAARGLVSEDAVPLWTAADAAPRLLLLGGAPGAELKYLRRWASDAGFAVQAQFDAGGGVMLGDPRIAIAAATLRRFDVVVLDERSWAALGAGERAALAAAARGGLGLLLRVTGPLPDATRRQWAALGLAVSPGGAARGAPLSPATAVPLSRHGVRIAGADIVALLRDAGGTPLGAWRAIGQGRIAVWSVLDSFALMLAGERAHYGAIWSDLLATLARATPGSPPTIAPLPQAGQRMALCGLREAGAIRGPAGTTTPLRIDPATGAGRCAAFWPGRSGWHVLRQADRATPFFVHAATALPGIRAAGLRDATREMVAAGDPPAARAVRSASGVWRYAIGFLVCAGLLWWLERRRGAVPV